MANPQFILHTDGACPGNGQLTASRGGWAFVIRRLDGSEVARGSGSQPATTNNAMELLAVQRGLEEIPPGASITVVTDSKNVIGWLGQSWKVKALHLKPSIDASKDLIRLRQVTFRWIKGHGSDPTNLLCDALAVAAANGA